MAPEMQSKFCWKSLSFPWKNEKKKVVILVGLVSLFNGISTVEGYSNANVILLEGH